MFTILDLAYSRQVNENEIIEGRFFYSRDEKKVEVYTHIEDMLAKYIRYYCKTNADDKEEKEYNEKMEELKNINISSTKGPIEKIIAHLDTLDIESDELYVHYFFRVVKRLFSGHK